MGIDWGAPLHFMRRSGFLFSLAVAIPILLWLKSSTGSAGAVVRHTLLCDDSLWSEPAPAFADSGAVVYPALAAQGDSLIVVGHVDTVPLRNAPEIRAVLLGWGAITTPTLERSAYQPVPLFGPDGSIHLLWAELGSEPAAGDTPISDRSFARIAHSRQMGPSTTIIVEGQPLLWSTPEVVFEAASIAWRSAGAGSVVPMREDGTIHLVFSLDDRQELVYIRQQRTMRQITQFLRPGAYARLARGTNGDLYMPYISGWSEGYDWDENSVLFRRSNDDGRTWSEPVLVSRSGMRPAHDVQIAVSSDGTIHLVWRKTPVNGRRPTTVWHTRSEDEGRTWTEPDELGVAGSYPAEVRITPDGLGGIHAVVVWSNLRGDATWLGYSKWNGADWTPPCEIQGGGNGLEIAVITGGGDVHLVWNRLAVDSLKRPLHLVTLHSVITESPQ